MTELPKARDLDVTDAIRAGLTEDDDQNKEQAERTAAPDGADTIARTLGEVRLVPGTRIPAPVFVATDDTDSMWMDGVHDDRLQRGAIVSFPPDVVEAIRSGHICLRCLEPHESAFPIKCDLCGYGMREHQAAGFAVEFQGITHLGPSKPLQAYVDEQETERQKAVFSKKLKEGASKMLGLRGRAS